MLELYDLKTEYRDCPLGLDVQKPAFSWKLRSDRRNVTQASCRIRVTCGDREVWDSGLLNTNDSLYHVYAGMPLNAKTRYDVTVEVIDNNGEQAEGRTWFETGFLNGGDIQASLITHGFEDDLKPCAVFRKTFELNGTVKKARAYVSALGIYTVTINGTRVGDAYLAPGWTSYQGRLQYQTYDITEYLQESNVIEITAANGWYKGILGFYNQGNHYGTRTAVIAQLEVETGDGVTETISTDESWISTTGSVRYSELYHGEVIDFSLGAQEERPVSVITYPKEQLTGQISEPVRITERIPVKEVLHAPSGMTILDFGQNFAGVVEARLKCPKETKITLRHGEMLDENGELFTTNLRTAKATDTFICGGGEDVFHPEFTFHGFRYVGIEGLDDVHADDFTGCVMHTDYARTGTFSCSNEKVTKLWQNIDWTMRSNYMDVPMDCPQRDERLGYTGDAEIFLPTALFHGDLALFYRKWLGDLKIEQTDTFGVPLTVPDILRTHVCVNIWHDAAAIVPWAIYQTYGDLRVLEDQYDSIKGCVEYSRRTAGEGLLLQPENSSQFGDWVALDAPKGPFRQPTGGEMKPSMDEKGGGTDSHLIGNVYYLNSIDILRRTATLLGNEADAKEYDTLYETVLAAFRREYITAGGRLVGETQTAAALVLYFHLCEEKDRERILQKLQLNLIKNKKHLLTGFVGTEYLPHVLSQNGMHSLAGDILLKEDCPSWLYEVNLGATTVWELWDGVNPDHSINPFAMNSFNQYGFASIGDWMVKQLAGITALEPGYKKSRIMPQLVRGIEEVNASYETPYGTLHCELSCKNRRIHACVTVPANTEAEVILPEREAEVLGSGSYEYDYETELSFAAGKYSDDSILRDMLKEPAAKEYFETVMPDLAHDPLVNNFAGRMSIAEIKATLPETMVPKKAYPVFEEMIRLLNKQG